MSWGDPQPDEELTAQDAIRFIEDCRASHVRWINWERRGEVSAAEKRIAGANMHHQMWVRRYNHVLRVLWDRS